MFNVTVDYLLDVDILKKEEEIKEILKKDDEIAKGAPTAYTSLLMNGFEENPSKWTKTNECSSVERVKSNFEESK